VSYSVDRAEWPRISDSSSSARGIRAVQELDSRRTLLHMDDPRPLPNVGAPAARALAEAGVWDLNDVETVGLDHLATLHGVGPKAIRLLRAELEK